MIASLVTTLLNSATALSLLERETAPKSAGMSTRVMVCGDKGVSYATDLETKLVVQTFSGHQELMKQSAQQDAENAWDTWKTWINSEIPALHTSLSKPKVVASFTPFDVVEPLILAEVSITFCDHPFRWKWKLGGHSFPGGENRVFPQIDALLLELRSLPLSTHRFFFEEKINWREGGEYEAKFKRSVGADAESARQVLAWLTNGAKTLEHSKASEQYTSLLNKAVFQDVSQSP